MRRLPALSALAAALVLGLAACSPELPEPQPDAAPSVLPPALSTEQLDSILADVAATLEVADAAATVEEADAAAAVEALDSRIDGPALQIRSVEYALAGAGDAEALTPIPSGAQTFVVPATDTWPRTVMVVTEPPEDLQAPLLLTLVQADPRSPYELQAWARLFPGVQTPPTTQPEIGSQPVESDEQTLMTSPEDVVAQYVDLLTLGAESEYAETFTEDPLRAGIAATKAAFTESASVNGGSLAETYQAAGAGPYAIATADGGAIVVGVIETLTTITLDDSVLTLGDESAVLLGKETVTTSLAFTWLSVVAFAVPPADSDGPIQVLGAEHSRIRVTGE